MNKLNIFLILNIFSSFFVFCACNQNKNEDEPITILLSASYSNPELFSGIMLTDSLLNLRNNATEGQNPHPLLNLLRPNIYQDESGSFFVTPSSFIGFAAAKDTSAITGYLRNSPVLPDSITFEWSHIKEPVVEYGLIAHRQHEISIQLSNEDIESLHIEQEPRSSASGLSGLINVGFDNRLIITLNESGIHKIKELLSQDAILLKTNIGQGNTVISIPAAELKDGIIIMEDITNSDVKSLRKMYPIIMKQE